MAYLGLLSLFENLSSRNRKKRNQQNFMTSKEPQDIFEVVSPELTAGLVDLALLILTNKKSACLNRAGCIN